MKYGKKFGNRAKPATAFTVKDFTEDSVKNYYNICIQAEEVYRRALHDAEKNYKDVQKALYEGLIKTKEQAERELMLKPREENT